MTGSCDGERFGVRHPFEHLDVDLSLDTSGPGHFEGPRQVEKVVARYADANGVGMFATQRDIDESGVARVDVGLGSIRRCAPAVQFGLGRLHRQVGALHQSDFDGATGSFVTRHGPLDQVGERGVRFGQVGLQHDAGGDARELRFVKDPFERRDRQFEVAELLHVEVDEGVVLFGLAVEESQLLSDPIE